MRTRVFNVFRRIILDKPARSKYIILYKLKELLKKMFTD